MSTVSLATATRYQLNQIRYMHDPVGFARDMIVWPDGGGLTPYQAESLAMLASGRRTSVRGPHGLGKSCMSAVAVLWFALTRDGLDWKAITTASRWRQLTKFLWPEIHRWARMIDWDRLGRRSIIATGELMVQNLKMETGEAFPVASDQPWGLEGAHADHLLIVFDESKAVKDETFDALEGAMSGAGRDTGREALAMAISTPGPKRGRFYEIHARKPGFEDWWTRHVTLDEAMAAGRISADWVEARAAQWGEQSALFLNRVKGEFAAGADDGMIPAAWVEAAIERWQDLDERGDVARLASQVDMVALDVADGGDDDSAIVMLAGDVVLPVEYIRDQRPGETMQVTGRMAALLRKHGCSGVIDRNGVGAGPYSRLLEQDLDVYGFNNGAGTRARDATGDLLFADLGMEAWWLLRDMLDPAGNPTLALPPDDRLVADITTPRMVQRSNGRVAREPKELLRKADRLGRSPDAGDALAMALWARRRGSVDLIAVAPWERV